MTTQSEQAPDKIELVTAQEQLVLEKIARGYASHSQLAIALSVLNEGSTHGQATEKKRSVGRSGQILGSEVPNTKARCYSKRLAVYTRYARQERKPGRRCCRIITQD